MSEQAATRRMRESLETRIRRSGTSLRELERQLGLSHGTLSHILRGRTELRIRHLVLLGQALGFTLEEFFVETFVLRGEDDPSLATLEGLVTRIVRAELDARREADEPKG